jgi:putative transposase
MKIQVHEYIENWYNKKRRHTFLGFKTIEEFDRINLDKFGDANY